MSKNNDKKNKTKQPRKTFSIRSLDSKFNRYIKKAIFDYKHLENMLNILINEAYQSKNWTIYNLITNQVIMKAVLSNNSGGIKTKDSIKIVDDFYKDNAIMKEIKTLGSKLNAHNMSMVVKELAKNWSNFKSNYELWFKEGTKSGLTGKPSHPKPKKLKDVYQFALDIEPDKFTLKKKNLLGLNLYKNMKYTFFKHVDYIVNKNIKSLNVSYRHGVIYFNFGYIVEDNTIPKVRKNRKSKLAGGDIGIYNLMALFINDTKTDSLLIDNSNNLAKNRYFNKLIDNLKREISKEVLSYKTVNGKNNSHYEVPNEYTNKGKNLKKQLGYVLENRNRYFDDQFNKISTKILTYLKQNGVTEFIISKNLSFVKSNGKIHQQNSFSQKFFQIPFGRLLNMIEEKASQYAIKVVSVDEAYTSKSSCINDNVKDVQDKKVLPNELSGVRGKKGSKLTRGLFRDNKFKKAKVFNSDVNGAANHIKVGYPDVSFNYLKKHLRKLCNPIKIKSANEFDCLIAR